MKSEALFAQSQSAAYFSWLLYFLIHFFIDRMSTASVVYEMDIKCKFLWCFFPLEKQSGLLKRFIDIVDFCSPDFGWFFSSFKCFWNEKWSQIWKMKNGKLFVCEVWHFLIKYKKNGTMSVFVCECQIHWRKKVFNFFLSFSAVSQERKM